MQIKGKSHQFPVPVGILVSSRTDSSHVSQMVLPTVGVTAFRAWGFLVKVWPCIGQEDVSIHVKKLIFILESMKDWSIDSKCLTWTLPVRGRGHGLVIGFWLRVRQRKDWRCGLVTELGLARQQSTCAWSSSTALKNKTRKTQQQPPTSHQNHQEIFRIAVGGEVAHGNSYEVISKRECIILGDCTRKKKERNRTWMT